MTIKEMREKAARAVTAAQAIVAEMKNNQGEWPADKTTSYQAALKEFSETHTEVQRLEKFEAEQRTLEEANAYYNKPAASVQINLPQPQSTEASVKEAFTQYVAPDKSGIYLGKEGIMQWAYNRGVADPAPLIKRCVEIHQDALRAYLYGDRDGLRAFAERQKLVGASEIFALLSNDQSLGGFTVPVDFQNEVIKASAGYAQIRNLARVQPTSRDALIWPKLKPHATDTRRTTGFTGTWRQQGYVVGGTAPTVQNQPTWQQERIPVHNWQPDAIEISTDLLEDSAVSIDSVIAQAIGEAKGLDEDDVFYNGTGVSQPEGIMQAGITTVNLLSATDLTWNGLINLYYNLPIQYRMRATWLMASLTFGNILKLTTGTGGVFVFNPQMGVPPSLLGRPYAFMEGMTAPGAAGTFTAADKPIIFGDFSNYIIAERTGLRIQRLIERFAPNIGFLPTARVGGQVVLTQGFRIGNISL